MNRSATPGPIDFVGRTAIVTGAGRGLGRAHALLLASRGARVVVNDLGTGIDGQGRDLAPAEAVTSEIEAAGGTAIPSTDDVATSRGGEALVQRAVDAFGSVDLLVHNAGFFQVGNFEEVEVADVRRLVEVNLFGAWHVGQPVWSHMLERGYGRIVLTGSGAVFGFPVVSGYAAAKLGLVGVARSLQQAAIAHDADICVNVVCPMADTRLGGGAAPSLKPLLGPAEVSAVVAYLLSEGCRLQGEVLLAGGTHIARVFLGQTEGWAKGEAGLTPEEVRDHLGEILDLDGWDAPASMLASVDRIYGRIARAVEGNASR